MRRIGDKIYYNVVDLVEILELSPQTIRKYFLEGRIKGHKVGKEWHATAESVQNFMEGK